MNEKESNIYIAVLTKDSLKEILSEFITTFNERPTHLYAIPGVYEQLLSILKSCPVELEGLTVLTDDVTREKPYPANEKRLYKFSLFNSKSRNALFLKNTN